VAGKCVDTIRAVSTPMTRRYSAIIYINFTVLAAESSLTDAPVAVDVIEARAAVETR